jgi:ketosteroid isomerase-like protein
VLLESPSLYVHNDSILQLAAQAMSWPQRIYLGVGTYEGNRPNCDTNQSGGQATNDVRRLAKLLDAAGIHALRVKTVIEPCAVHDEAAWSKRLPIALSFLFGPDTGAVGAISKQAARFSRAYERGDGATIIGLYTADATLLPADGSRLYGKRGVTRYWGNIKARDVSHWLETDDLIVTGTTAIESGTWNTELRSPNEGSRRNSGRYVIGWRKEADGEWRMTYDMWSAVRK